jgi:hypothetical protein
MKTMLIKEYFGDKNGREAKVLLTPKGYEIQLEQDGGKAERGQTIFTSESSAGDACEDWVNGVDE